MVMRVLRFRTTLGWVEQPLILGTVVPLWPVRWTCPDALILFGAVRCGRTHVIRPYTRKTRGGE